MGWLSGIICCEPFHSSAFELKTCIDTQGIIRVRADGPFSRRKEAYIDGRGVVQFLGFVSQGELLLNPLMCREHVSGGFFVSISHVPIMLPVGGDGVGGDGWIIGTWSRSRGRGRVDYRNIGI